MSLRARLQRILLVLAVATSGTVTTALPAEAEATALCRLLDVQVPADVTDHQVMIVPGTAARTWTIHGELCLPSGATASTVLLALHGITYKHDYWDPGYQPERYSFARAMAAAGYATYAPDRLGYGDSSHPASALVSLDSDVAVTHSLIGSLRTGGVGGTGFRRVVLVGNSYGSAISWRESELHNDADAVVATGYASVLQNDAILQLLGALRPAAADPAFAGRGLDPGYLTPRPGQRETGFIYYPDNADPAMVAYDEARMRDTVTVGEGSIFLHLGAYPLGPFDIPNVPQTENINIPSFLLNGSHDTLTCGPQLTHCTSDRVLQNAENRYFSASACFRAGVVPASGHVLNLHRNAAVAFAKIRAWLDQAVGPDGSRLPAYRARCK
ncbi:MAG TPA: alpha/beta hydrolase [Sporichthyaceae bacterium]|nr:alpha/beta hydrolase [Sporichthyaceae bacterium]